MKPPPAMEKCVVRKRALLLVVALLCTVVPEGRAGITQMFTPGNAPCGVAMEGGFMWHSDKNGATYKGVPNSPLNAQFDFKNLSAAADEPRA